MPKDGVIPSPFLTWARGQMINPKISNSGPKLGPNMNYTRAMMAQWGPNPYGKCLRPKTSTLPRKLQVNKIEFLPSDTLNVHMTQDMHSV